MLASVVLFVWPLAALVFFATLGRERGLIWSVVTGYLFLPEMFAADLPGLPAYGKSLAIALGALFGATAFRKRPSWPEERPAVHTDSRRLTRILYLLIIVLLFAFVVTMLDNRSPLIDGSRVRTGMSFRDVISMSSDTLIAVIPFFLGLRLLHGRRHHDELLKAVVIMGVVYALLALVEIRLSPQLNKWVYGFFPHDWRQHLRGGGFRPVVFLRHGLWLAFFLLTALLAAFALARQDRSTRLGYALAGLWILAVLLISNNLGAVLLAGMFIPLVLFLPRTIQIRTITVVAILFLSYPAVRQAHLLPLDGFLNFVSSISEERAASFQFRLDNETDLLDRAAEKPLFGWGGWGRWRVIDERGRDTTVSDGGWAIVLGERGWVGYICYFGLLTLPLLFLGRVARRREIPRSTAAIGVILAANLVYLVPNSTLSSIAWMMSGSIAGFIQWRTVARLEDAAVAEPGPPVSRYTRFARTHDRTELSASAALARRR